MESDPTSGPRSAAECETEKLREMMREKMKYQTLSVARAGGGEAGCGDEMEGDGESEAERKA